MEFGKVNQLDAMLLDGFYQEKIIERVLKSYPFDKKKRFLAAGVIKTIYLFSGLWSGKSTEGNQIYNIVYLKPSTLFLILHYFSELFQVFVENFQEQAGAFGTTWNILSLLNWVLFLAGGRFRTLSERIGRVQLPLANPKSFLNIDYFYTKRAIFFQVLSDTAKILIPEVQLERVLSFFNSEANILAESGEACAVCGEEDIVSPSKFMNCVHTACYYCYCSVNSLCPQCK